MHESSKSIFHKIKDSRYATRYFKGHGIDIGAGGDPLAQYMEFFPLMESCRSWDVQDGDAELMSTIDDSSLDFVHSSHCLEHMVNVENALTNWLRILKPKGHLVCLIPDEDLYEQGVYPSTFNSDHKHTFTVGKARSWSPVSINLISLLNSQINNFEILKIELLDSTYRYSINNLTNARFDQTLTPIGECAIEFILRKK